MARASFVTNIIFGRSTLNAFQLARGYMPGIAGLSQTVLSQDLLDIHTKMAAHREQYRDHTKVETRDTLKSQC